MSVETLVILLFSVAAGVAIAVRQLHRRSSLGPGIRRRESHPPPLGERLTLRRKVDKVNLSFPDS